MYIRSFKASHVVGVGTTNSDDMHTASDVRTGLAWDLATQKANFALEGRGRCGHCGADREQGKEAAEMHCCLFMSN